MTDKGNITEEQEQEHQQFNPSTLSETISNCLRSLNSGAFKIYIDNQPVLKLTINQARSNNINLEFGQKFIEMSLSAGTSSLTGK
jgi:hypothetical protein